MASLQETLGNDAWMKTNLEAIRSWFPVQWEYPSPDFMHQVGFKMKLLGIDWRENTDLGKAFAFFERTGIIERNGIPPTIQIRRRPLH